MEQFCQGQGHREEGENISLEDLQLGGWRDLGRQVLLGSSQDLNLPGKEWFDRGGGDPLPGLSRPLCQDALDRDDSSVA